MFSSILIIISYLLIINLISIKSISYSLSESFQLNHSKILNELKLNITKEELFQKKIFLPEYQNKFSRINELNDTNFNFEIIRNNRSVALIPSEIIDKNEKQLFFEKISDIINSLKQHENDTYKEFRNQNEFYPDDYSFYSDTISFYNDLDSFYHKFIKSNSLIYDRGSSSIRDIISTNPTNLIIKAEICKPKLIVFKIINPNLEENLIIKSVKSDLYQLKLFPNSNIEDIGKIGINQHDFENLTPELNSVLEYSIPPKSSYSFQILFLLDLKTFIKGTLYIEFNEKKVLLIPIELSGRDNIYKINPIYYPNFQINKLFYTAVELYNPTTKVLAIKEIIHSFQKIKIIWPNGDPFGHNTSIDQSMLQINPLTSKKIFYLKLYSSKPENFYGFIHIRTDNSHLNNLIMIPVFINLVNFPILPYPKFLNFGLCDVTPKSRNNFIRMIPLNMLNDGNDYIKLGKVYIDYDELFLQFHQNFGGENIVLKPGEDLIYGYVIFNGNLEKNFEDFLIKDKKFFGQIIKKSLYIETNYTYTPLIEIEYSYMLSQNNQLIEIKGNIQTLPKNIEKFSFLTNIKLKKPIKLKKYNNILPGINRIIYNDKFVIAKIQNPISDSHVYESNITIDIKRMSKWKNNHYYFIPILLNYKLFTLVPIQINDKELIAIYCGNEENSKSLSICIKNLNPENIINNINGAKDNEKFFNIDFSYTREGIKQKKYIYLINYNESPIIINKININNNKEILFINFEGYEYFGGEDESSEIKYLKSIESLIEFKKVENFISFQIYPNTAVKLSINLLANNLASNELKINSFIKIFYDNGKVYIISVSGMIFKGSINLSPNIYIFEPSFPGLYQSTTIYANSSFNFPLDIFSVSSSDERIIPRLLVDKIYPDQKIALIEVRFDPSKSYFIEDLAKFNLNMTNTLTYKELYLWKAKEKYFNKLGSTGRTEINAYITIKTSLGKEDINFKSFLIKPNLAKNNIINFGAKQVGESSEQFFELINPSDNMLSVKLVLAEDEFTDLNKDFMFNIKEQNLIKNYNDLIIFGCNFILLKNGSEISKYEYIVVPENIDPIELRKGTFDKNNLILMLYKYGNEKVKSYLLQSNDIFCKYDRKTQNEIIFNNNNINNYLISRTYSNEFNNEILNIKNMTYKKSENDFRKQFVEQKNFYDSIISYFSNLYLKYIMNIPIKSNIKIIEQTQSFYIPSNIQENIYQIPPHNKMILGPIIFKPNISGPIKGTLFAKNNLTILYSFKLIGSGGGGNIQFLNYYQKEEQKTKFLDKGKFLIEIDEEIYEKEMKENGKLIRTFKIKNIGNLNMTVKNITIDDKFQLQTNTIRIVQNEEFTLNKNVSRNIDIEIIPNFKSLEIKRIIYINSDYESFPLYVSILISKDLYEIKNYIYIYIKCFLIAILTVIILLFSLYKIINVIKKQRREITEKKIIEEEKEEKKESLLKNEKGINNNENDFDYNNMINNNWNQNKNKQKPKKRKNRQKSNSSNNQLEDNDISKKNTNENIENNYEKYKNNEENNDHLKEEKIKENVNNEIKNNNNNNKKINYKESNSIKPEIKNRDEITKEKKIQSLDISKENNINIKGSIQILHNRKETKKNANDKKELEEEISSDRAEFKMDRIKEGISKENINVKIKERKKVLPKKKFQIIENKNLEKKMNEIENNEINTETNNYNYNYYNNKLSYQYKNKKGRKELNKKFYLNNKKYYNYDNYSNINTYNNYSIYNTYYQHPKKNITKIKTERNAKNLKELFEIEQHKRLELKEDINNPNLKQELKEKEEIENLLINNKNIHNTSNININNISNINLTNDEEINEEFDEELFENKRLKEFDYKYPITKKINSSKSDKNEEMNPTFLNDIKTNNAFEAEQELIKSLKKENKELSNKSNNAEMSKEDLDIDFINNSHFNFDYYFFDPQQDNDESEYKGDYEDFKFKSLIDNLNNVDNQYEEQKGKLDLLLNNNSNNNIDNKEEKENKKAINENEYNFKYNEYEQFNLPKNKFDKFDNYNIFDFEINNDNQNNEEKNYQNKFDE